MITHSTTNSPHGLIQSHLCHYHISCNNDSCHIIRILDQEAAFSHFQYPVPVIGNVPQIESYDEALGRTTCQILALNGLRRLVQNRSVLHVTLDNSQEIPRNLKVLI